MPSGVALALHSRRHAVQEDKLTMVYAIQVLTSILIMVIFAVSLNLLLGYTGQLSMAHAVLGACGGYLVGYLSINYGLGYVPALLLGGLAGLVAGALISLPAMRLDPAYLLIMTFGFANALLALFMSLPGLGGTKCLLGIQPMSVFGIPLNNAWLRLPAIAIPAIIIFLICWRLAESPFGRVLKGIREDEVATRSLGKNIFTFKLMTFALTAGMAGVAGAITIFNLGGGGEHLWTGTGSRHTFELYSRVPAVPYSEPYLHQPAKVGNLRTYSGGLPSCKAAWHS